MRYVVLWDRQEKSREELVLKWTGNHKFIMGLQVYDDYLTLE